MTPIKWLAWQWDKWRCVRWGHRPELDELSWPPDHSYVQVHCGRCQKTVKTVPWEDVPSETRALVLRVEADFS